MPPKNVAGQNFWLENLPDAIFKYLVEMFPKLLVGNEIFFIFAKNECFMAQLEKVNHREGSFITFMLGLVVGAALTFFCVMYFIGKNAGSNGSESPSVTLGEGMSIYKDPGLSLFNEPGDVMPLKSFKVFQVLNNGWALAQSSSKPNAEYGIEFGDPVVYLKPIEGKAYYDDMVLNLSSKKVARQIGTYRYETQKEFVKTVPVIEIFDK